MESDLDAVFDRLADALAERIAARLANGASASTDMLTPDEAARLLRTDRRWIYRNAEKLGAVHLTRRKMRIPRAGIQRYLKRSR
jgi:excisionase family DNA binding protein